ncbi:MAG: NAD(P)H-hydrate dehydratase [Gallionella sp.]|jgi:hydroxyethylthiazole kinase-like uncharacterized protein yjeF
MNPQVIKQSQVAKLLPERPKDSHKGLFGTVTVIGGASGMTGAALLAGRAALKLGAGCVHVVLLADNAPVVDFVQPELMIHSASDQFCPNPHPNPPPERGETNVRNIFNSDVLVVGCGMGHDTTAKQMLHLALQGTATLVLDADALNLIAMHPDLYELLIARKNPTVLTPHPGEAARLLGCSTAEIQNNRIASVQQLAERFACSVVLKGAHSLCATSRGLFVNQTGNPGMSGPGMGDALSGMIAALIAQGLSVDDALLLAVHLHGAAGDELAKLNITTGMTATEVTDQARLLLNQWLIN